MERASILIVEDEYLLAMEIRIALEESGYKVAGIAMSGEEAVEQAEKERPDLVLMDIKLHGDSDGVEAARRIRERFGTPVIFLTGNVDGKTRERVREADPSGFIHKPVVEHELLAMLENVLNTGP
jgi:CheY-like chemotaxis protein